MAAGSNPVRPALHFDAFSEMRTIGAAGQRCPKGVEERVFCVIVSLLGDHYNTATAVLGTRTRDEE